MKAIVKIIIVNICLTILVILILELSFGDWLTAYKLSNLNVIRSKTINYPLDGLYNDPGNTILYRRDKYGLRGQYNSINDISLLTVGGSTTDQRYISEGHTWQDILDDSFQSAGRKDVVVANAGIDGQTTYGHIKNFDYWFPHVPGLHPKYILFYIGINDFHVDEGFGFDRLVSDEEKSFKSVLRENSAFYRLLRIVHGIYLVEVKAKIGHMKVDVSGKMFTRHALQSDYSFMDRRLKEYKERLFVLIKKTRDFGSTPIFVTQPSRRYRFKNGVLEGTAEVRDYDGHLINGIDYFIMKSRLDVVTFQTCKENMVMFIDTAKANIWDDADFYDYIHMTPSGARKLGEYLYMELKTKI